MTGIYGVGVDQVNLNRVRKLLSKNKSKFESRCFTKNCECSIEKAETDGDILRSIRIGRKSKIPRDTDMDKSVHNLAI